MESWSLWEAVANPLWVCAFRQEASASYVCVCGGIWPVQDFILHGSDTNTCLSAYQIEVVSVCGCGLAHTFQQVNMCLIISWNHSQVTLFIWSQLSLRLFPHGNLTKKKKKSPYFINSKQRSKDCGQNPEEEVEGKKKKICQNCARPDGCNSVPFLSTLHRNGNTSEYWAHMGSIIILWNSAKVKSAIRKIFL